PRGLGAGDVPGVHPRPPPPALRPNPGPPRGHAPAPRPPRPRRHRPGQTPLRPPRRTDPARGALDRRPGRGAGRTDVRDVDPPQRRHGEGARASSSLRRIRVRSSGVGLLAAARALLHALRRGRGLPAGPRRGAPRDRFVGGSQLVPIRLAEQLGDRVRLGVPVRKIEQDGECVTVSGDALAVTARRVIVAVPPALAGRIVYEPPLPGVRDQLTHRVPAGSVIKCHAVYDTAFWLHAGLTRAAPAAPRARVMIAPPPPPPAPAPGPPPPFREGPPPRHFPRADPDDRRAAVIGSLVDFFGPRAAEPMEYVDLDWSDEEWTRG